MRYESGSTSKDYFRASMNSIYENSTSGEGAFNNNDKSDFILVEYPGVVKNIDKALSSLGGISAVSLATACSRQLELCFQPENVYQNGLVAEKKTVDEVISGQIRLVVRIRKRKNRKIGDNKEKALIKDVKCLGLVSMVFSFKSMCDFHYLPVRKTVKDSKILEDLVPRLIPTNFESALTWWEKTTSLSEAQTLKSMTPHFLPPSVFSRYTTANTKILCSVSAPSLNEGGDTIQSGDVSTAESGKNEAGGSPRKSIGHAKNLRMERKAATVTVHGNEPFPLAPSEVALKDVALRVKLERPHQMLAEMFNERPLWTRVAMLQRTELDENVLKVILAKYAFYISSGPWGRCWCRFGYDPRKDPNAKQFQTIMVSFRDHKNIPERQRLKLSVGNSANHPAVFNKLLDYEYKPGVLPPVRQMWYCVCDVHLPAAEKVMRKDFFAVLKQCHETHGWLPPEIINSIRNGIKEDVRRVSHLLEINDELVDGTSPATEKTRSLSSNPLTTNPYSISNAGNAEDNGEDSDEMTDWI